MISHVIVHSQCKLGLLKVRKALEVSRETLMKTSEAWTARHPLLGQKTPTVTGQGPSREDPWGSGFSTYLVHCPMLAK